MAIGSSIRRASSKLSDADNNNNNYNSRTAADPEYSDEVMKRHMEKANIQIKYNIENSTKENVNVPITVTEEVSNYNKAMKKFNSLSSLSQLILFGIVLYIIKKIFDKLVISKRPTVYVFN